MHSFFKCIQISVTTKKGYFYKKTPWIVKIENIQIVKPKILYPGHFPVRFFIFRNFFFYLTFLPGISKNFGHMVQPVQRFKCSKLRDYWPTLTLLNCIHQQTYNSCYYNFIIYRKKLLKNSSIIKKLWFYA